MKITPTTFCADYRESLDVGLCIQYAYWVRTLERSSFIQAQRPKGASRTMRMILQ